MSKILTFGIDLGTTNSCISHSSNGIPSVVTTKAGKRIIPSFISFNNNKIIVGELAKNSAPRNVTNTVYDVKRLIGHKYSERKVQLDLPHWGFRVTNDDNDDPLIVVNYEGKDKKFSPPQISSFVIKELAGLALSFTNSPPDTSCYGVITVPAYFDDLQRRATIEAGRLAGINVLRVINEPTAAAIAYGYKYLRDKSNSTILIYDLGGGTFDVSIIEVKNNEITVKATDGDTHLGGEDIDNNLVKYYAEQLKAADYNIYTKPKKLYQLKRACEEAKCVLSVTKDTVVGSDVLEDKEINATLTRAFFNSLNEELFQKTLTIVKNTLKASGYSKDQIQDIVLTGGSSRIPRIQELLSEYFNKSLNQDINPDEAVSMGAAILAEDALRGLHEEERNGKKVLVVNDTGKTYDIEGRESFVQKVTPSSPKRKLESSTVPLPIAISGTDEGYNKPIGKISKSRKKVLLDENEIIYSTDNSVPSSIPPSPAFKSKDIPDNEFAISGPGQNIRIFDVLSHSIGKRVKGNIFSVILPKNSVIPCKKSKIYTTVKDNQPKIKEKYYEGDDPVASNNREIYQLEIPDLPKAKAGELRYECIMEMDLNGLLHLKVKDSNGNTVKATTFRKN